MAKAVRSKEGIERRRIKSKEVQAEKRKTHEYRIQMLFNASKARARNKQREHTITVQDILNAWPPDNKCPVFGFELKWNSTGFRETSPSIDRMDSTKGYTKENIQIISWKANRIKGYASIEELEILLAYLKQGE